MDFYPNEEPNNLGDKCTARTESVFFLNFELKVGYWGSRVKMKVCELGSPVTNKANRYDMLAVKTWQITLVSLILPKLTLV